MPYRPVTALVLRRVVISVLACSSSLSFTFTRFISLHGKRRNYLAERWG